MEGPEVVVRGDVSEGSGDGEGEEEVRHMTGEDGTWSM